MHTLCLASRYFIFRRHTDDDIINRPFSMSTCLRIDHCILPPDPHLYEAPQLIYFVHYIIKCLFKFSEDYIILDKSTTFFRYKIL